jgi:hypothetical protein
MMNDEAKARADTSSFIIQTSSFRGSVLRRALRCFGCRIRAARRAFDVARARPLGECARVVAEDVADDGIQLAHGFHAALYRLVYRGGGGDTRALFFRPAVDQLLEGSDVSRRD